ncbi:MAG: hypothetical protein NC125_02125, partial [Muribaculaceae bacterium]|nr:hypothetical protein [Muribaculaceae bacterium]
MNASVKADVPETMVVNEEKTLTKSGAPSEATVTYTSDKADVVAVDGSKITAKAAGEANITVTSSYGATKTYKVTVGKYALQSVKQTRANTIEAVILGATKDLKPADVKITNTANNNVFAVKAVNVDGTDATKVTIETFADMNDGATYTVSVDNGAAAEFTATDGVVAELNVAPLQIAANTEGTEIKGQTIDKNGIILKEFTVSDAAGITEIDFSLTTTQGYVDGNKLVLPTVGNKGTA